MRVSIDKRDPGYRYNAGAFFVKFNGEEVSHVVTADEEKGYIKRYVLEDGHPKVAPDGQHYLIEQVEGQVVIVAKNAAGEDIRLPKVKVERNEEGAIEVLVYSRIKPGSIKRATLDQKTLDLKRWTVQAAVAICAGAAAERLCEQLGDLFDPSDCAGLAAEEYARLLSAESAN
jgi:hypothetical protein